MWRSLICCSALLFLMGSTAHAEEASVTLRKVTSDGSTEAVGVVKFRDSALGMIIEPDLSGLTPGPHGAHVHENPSCAPAPSHHGPAVPAGAAGDHLDPKGTGRHAGPYGDGHLGDLPNLIVEQDGRVRISTLAPRVKVADLKGRSLMIHAGADRYQDHEDHAHGQGGDRMYCGVIEYR